MIVTPVSVTDAACVRWPYSRVTSPLLNIFPLTVVGTALVNAPSGITYPTGVIPVDGTSVGWDALGSGLYVRITSPDGTVRKHTGYTRLGNSATEVRINGINVGDTGQALETALAIADNDLVTVYQPTVPGASRSRIDPDTGELLKRWSIAYNDQTIEPQPRPIQGGNEAAWVDPITGVATFILDASDSEAWLSHTESYQWTFPSGGITIVSGTDTDPTITVEVEPGARRINLVVTDATTARLQETRRIRYAVDNDTFQAFNQVYNVSEFPRDTSDRTGWQFAFTVSGNAGDLPTEDDYLYIGAPVTLTYIWEFSEDGETWEQLDDADGTRNFNGFILSWSAVSTNEDGVSSITVEVVSITYYFERLPLAIQALTEKTTPTDWTEVDVDLNNVLYYLYYLLDEHSVSLARLADVRDDDDFISYRRASMKCDAPNFLSGLQNVASLVPGGNIGALSYGAISTRRLISLQDDTYRAATDNRFTFTTADFRSDDDTTPAAIAYTRSPLMKTASLQGGGFVWNSLGNTTGYLARAGLLAPTQGLDTPAMPDFVADSLAAVQSVVGHEIAYRNRPTDFIEIKQRHDLVEPAKLEPVLLDMGTHDPLETGLWDGRAVPLNVVRSWRDLSSGEPPLVVGQYEPVTYGQPAPQFIPGTIGVGYNPSPPPAYPALSIVWVTTGATPADWSGLSGTTETSPGNWYTGSTAWSNPTRASLANWSCVQATTTGAFGVLFDLGDTYSISHLEAQFTWTNTSNTKIAKFLGYHNGSWFEIYSQTFTGLSAGGTATFTGSTVASKLIWACKHGGTNPTISMLTSKINSP